MHSWEARVVVSVILFFSTLAVSLPALTPYISSWLSSQGHKDFRCRAYDYECIFGSSKQVPIWKKSMFSIEWVCFRKVSLFSKIFISSIGIVRHESVSPNICRDNWSCSTVDKSFSNSDVGRLRLRCELARFVLLSEPEGEFVWIILLLVSELLNAGIMSFLSIL